MGVLNRNPKGPAPNRESPYCAFKDDRHRLWALISRDIRAVVVCAILLFAEPALTSRFSHVLAMFGVA
ncbi:hypothetical protein SAMN04515618_10896 [Collimonas sp. OK307]|nr:hypothetical protein SAMN04515618_10896 [Collimonas sp. OK307]